MPKRHPPKYPKVLLRPRPRKSAKEYSELLSILYRHYGLDESKDYALPALAIHLLWDWVPAFRLDGRGRPTRAIDRAKRLLLLAEVNSLRARHPGMSELAARRSLARKQPGGGEFQGMRDGKLKRWLR